MRRLSALIPLGLAAALLAGCTAAPATEPGRGRSQPVVSRAVPGPGGGGSVSFAADWKAPFTGDLSRRHPVGCVRELVLLGVELDPDLAVTGPDRQEWRCAAVVEAVSWPGGGPIGLSAYVSTRSAQQLLAAQRTDTPDRRVRLDLLVADWDVDRVEWFARMRTPELLTGRVVDAGGPRLSVAESPTRIAANLDTEVYGVYAEIAPTADRQVVVVATGLGKTFDRPFQG